MVVTNDNKIDRDKLFDESQLNEAINAYFKFADGVAADGKSATLGGMRCGGICPDVMANGRDTYLTSLLAPPHVDGPNL